MSILLCLLFSGIASIQAQHNGVQWGTYGGTDLVNLSGTMIIPRKPTHSGTYYVWPGLQPATGGVLQEVCDGRTGNWWIGAGYYGTPSLPWGGGFSVAPGDLVTFINYQGSNGNWVSQLSASGGRSVTNNFPLPGIKMVTAVFDVELYGASWDFGPVVYPSFWMVSTSSDPNWCGTGPTWNMGSVAYAVGAVNPYTLSWGGSACNITNLVMWNPSALPLDILVPPATAAFSLRLLVQSYKGPAIRVRRDSDNTSKDIGFAGSSLDTTTLLNFVGKGNGYVVTWYDQSGAGNNATQSTAANQPQIVASGVINQLNGKPTIHFDSSKKTFMTILTYPFQGGSTASAYIVSQVLVAQNWQRYFDFGSGTSSYIFASPSNGINSRFRISTGSFANEQGPSGTGIVNTSPHLLNFKLGSSQMSIIQDGTAMDPAATGVTLLPSVLNGVKNNYIGKSQYSADPYFEGYMSEMVFFDEPATILTAQENAFVANIKAFYGL